MNVSLIDCRSSNQLVNARERFLESLPFTSDHEAYKTFNDRGKSLKAHRRSLGLLRKLCNDELCSDSRSLRGNSAINRVQLDRVVAKLPLGRRRIEDGSLSLPEGKLSGTGSACARVTATLVSIQGRSFFGEKFARLGIFLGLKFERWSFLHFDRQWFQFRIRFRILWSIIEDHWNAFLVSCSSLLLFQTIDNFKRFSKESWDFIVENTKKSWKIWRFWSVIMSKEREEF